MDLLVRNEPRVHYAQIRPMQTRPIHSLHLLQQALYSPHGVTMDCSESVTLLCHVCGLQDPNGFDYDGHGFTGTLLHHLPHYSDPGNARIGALVVFGPPQSGKSAGLAVPALLEWNGPAVASSIKNDLLAVTEARRRALGSVFGSTTIG